MFLLRLFLPDRQASAPPPDASVVNMDLLGIPSFPRVLSNMMYKRLSVMSEIADVNFLLPNEETMAELPEDVVASRNALSFVLTPVFDSYDYANDSTKVVAFFFILVPWQRYFDNVLPQGKNGFEVVVDDSCGSTFTFALDGPQSTLKSKGDTHDTKYDSMGKGWVYKDSFRQMVPADMYDVSTKPENECVYQIYVYPTSTLENAYMTGDPMQYAVAVSLIFVFTAIIFLAYDWAVARRQNKVLRTATRTQAIVASLFPENVQERILQEAETDEKTNTPRFRTNRTKDQLRSFLNDAEDDGIATSGASGFKSRPIADLFPEATVIFAE